jgi:hypothetical protein
VHALLCFQWLKLQLDWLAWSILLLLLLCMVVVVLPHSTATATTSGHTAIGPLLHISAIGPLKRLTRTSRPCCCCCRWCCCCCCSRTALLSALLLSLLLHHQHPLLLGSSPGRKVMHDCLDYKLSPAVQPRALLAQRLVALCIELLLQIRHLHEVTLVCTQRSFQDLQTTDSSEQGMPCRDVISKPCRIGLMKPTS